MSGNLSYFGRTNEVSDSTDITNSHPIIAGMLDNRNFNELEGVFEIEGHKIDAQIQDDGNIRVMAQEDVGDGTEFERVLLTNLFLKEFLEIYEDWRTMPVDEKYVHPRYFAELKKEAKEMENSADYEFNFDSLVKYYANLREENPHNYNFDFDS